MSSIARHPASTGKYTETVNSLRDTPCNDIWTGSIRTRCILWSVIGAKITRRDTMASGCTLRPVERRGTKSSGGTSFGGEAWS